MMHPDRKAIRARHEETLTATNRFGNWSLDKYRQNEGWVIYHWECGYWTHTFYNDSKNYCLHCGHVDVADAEEFPEEVEHLYRLLNFDLMTQAIWNASARRE
jgi:hypothetical protein